MKHELEKIKDLLYKLNYVLSGQQKRYGVIVFICTMISAAFEMLGVAAVLPIIEGLLDTEALREKWYVRPFADIFHVQSSNRIIMIVCIEVMLVYILKNLYYIFFVWLLKKYTYKVKRELGSRVMESYMAQGYIFFVNNNGAKLMQGITGDVSAVNGILTNIFNMIIKLLTIMVIGLFILIKEPFIAVFLLSLSAVCVLLIQVLFKNSMNKYGQRQREAAWDNYRACMEMIYGSKEILVARRQDYFRKRFVRTIVEQNNCNIKIEMATSIPAYIIEMVSIAGLLLAVMIRVAGGGATTDMIVGLSTIAIAAFRILPSVGAVSSSLNGIRSSVPAFNASYETIKKVNELEKEIKEREENSKRSGQIIPDELRLQKELIVDHISYRYPSMESLVLDDISLRIKAKTSIGIMGTSGAGKSTFVDVLLGLLEPEKGQIMMDGINTASLGKVWNKNIAYVPQRIYLVDEDIRSNIAFGIAKEEIDDVQVWRALEMAQLADFVREQPKGLNTIVGEWGVKFSGGQRQRVAIARALYSNPEILVLDEATAALDNDTEKALMEAIDSLMGHKTLIVVAHRLTTIQKCDYIYEVKDGKMIERSKQELFGN